MKLADFSADAGPPARSSGRDVSAYVVAGERVPSVTEVLDLAKLTDIEKLKRVAGADVVANAATRGKAVHIGCELVDRDLDFDLELLPESTRGYVVAYRNFLRETGFQVQLAEEPMVSTAHRFAGTVDRVGLYFDELYTVDLKTPAADSPAWSIQTAGYAVLTQENYGLETRRAALRLRPNGRYSFVPHHDENDIPTFLAAALVANYRLAHGLATLGD